MIPLFLITQGVIAVIVLLALPVLARCKSGLTVESGELRGLNLPRGSVRAMLALWIVGAYLTLLIFSPFVFSTKEDAGDKVDAAVLQTVVTAFGPLVGATIGFYFAGRSATPKPDNAPEAQDGKPGSSIG